MANHDASDTRSPLTAPPLRNPGQSLDEEINRVLDEDMLSYFMVAMFLLAITLMEWLRWWLNLPPQPLLYTVITVVVILYVARKLFVLRRKLRQLRLARDGERAVGQFLEALRMRGYRVLHDLIGDGFNVDHVLVGEAGLFTVETKTYHKPAKGKPEILYDGEHVTVAGHVPDRDPIVQAKAQAQWLQNILQESTGRRFKVQPIVLYSASHVFPLQCQLSQCSQRGARKKTALFARPVGTARSAKKNRAFRPASGYGAEREKKPRFSPGQWVRRGARKKTALFARVASPPISFS